MAISSDYPRPITVNGFVCRNCDDVSKAKKFEDPSAPKGAEVPPSRESDAVKFGGALAGLAINPARPAEPQRPQLDRYA